MRKIGVLKLDCIEDGVQQLFPFLEFFKQVYKFDSIYIAYAS